MVNQATSKSSRRFVLSSVGDPADNSVRYVLEETDPRALARTNVFYYLLAAETDLQLYINRRTGNISNDSSVAENNDDYQLLRGLTEAISDRYWILYVENLACQECVGEIRDNNEKVMYSLQCHCLTANNSTRLFHVRLRRH